MKSALVLAFAWLGLSSAANAQPPPDAGRGELLYTTHCIACHSDKVHWRERELVTDRESLDAQVRRWQTVSGLGWSDEDIAEVARYLNRRYYHFKLPD